MPNEHPVYHSKKYPYLPHSWSMEFLMGRRVGIKKPKFLKGYGRPCAFEWMLLICKQIFKLFNWFVKCFKGIFESIWMDSSETVNGYPFEDIELACHAFDSLYLLYTNLKRSFYR